MFDQGEERLVGRVLHGGCEGGGMTLRPRFIGLVVLLLSCARFASSSEGDGKAAPTEPRMRSLGLAGPESVRSVPRFNGRRFAVSPRGRDTNDCSEANPCREIRRAITLATAPGDVLLVADGEYAGFTANGLRGEPARPITIFATGHSAIVRSDPECTKKKPCRDTIIIRNSRHVVIDGLTSHQAPRAAVAIFYGDHITVRNGHFGDNGRWGIFTMFADDVVLEHNEVYGSRKEHGIYLSNSGDRPIVRFNVIHDNDGCGIHVNGDYREKPESDKSGKSFYAGPVDGLVSNAVIEGNLIYRNGSGVLANRKRRGGAGINLDGVWDSVVQANVLFENAAIGIAAFGDADGVEDDSKEDGDGRFGPRGLNIQHNTIVMPEGSRHALQLRLSRGVNTVSNNILHHTDRRRAGLDLVTPADAMLVTSNGNVLDRVAVSDRVEPLAAWTRESGQDKQSLSIPLARLFVDPARGDYSLLPSSPAAHLAPVNTTVVQQQQQQRDFLGKAPRNGRRSSAGACEASP
jgi:hypothetical protein